MPASRPIPFPKKYYAHLKSPDAILLETSRFDTANYRSFLFLEPLQQLVLKNSQDLPSLFAGIQDAVNNRHYVAGFLSYEAAEGLERTCLHPRKESQVPLAYFNVYPRAYVFDHLTGEFDRGEIPPEPGKQPLDYFCELKDVGLNIGLEEYSRHIEAIKEWIRSGDTYQVNFTDKIKFCFSGSPIGLYRDLLLRQEVSYGAFLNLGERQILSLSPELFFHVEGSKIRTRPMKGTAPRGRDLEEDTVIRDSLYRDEKNRSENLMIVDLLRNDLGRICEFGSVRVDDLFAVERYETLFQMTSGISGRLREGIGYWEIFRSLFPCGSITGAPKLRTMQIIRESEAEVRGIYTGAIGFFSPHAEAAFNVAIRTVVLSGSYGEMGVGSGIVYDSVAEEEYRECLLKASFLRDASPSFQLIETMLWDGSYQRLALHMQRLGRSSEYFAFAWDQEAIINKLSDYASSLAPDKRYRVRLLMEKSGKIQLSSVEIEAKIEDRPLQVAISPVQTSVSDPFLRHKTTNRALYEEWRSRALQKGFDEILFLNEENQVTEGSISNIFVEIEGLLLTPPVSCGLLPGIYRQFLLESHSDSRQKVLTIGDLRSAEAIYFCNSVRGMKRAEIQFDAVI